MNLTISAKSFRLLGIGLSFSLYPIGSIDTGTSYLVSFNDFITSSSEKAPTQVVASPKDSEASIAYVQAIVAS